MSSIDRITKSLDDIVANKNSPVKKDVKIKKKNSPVTVEYDSSSDRSVSPELFTDNDPSTLTTVCPKQATDSAALSTKGKTRPPLSGLEAQRPMEEVEDNTNDVAGPMPTLKGDRVTITIAAPKSFLRNQRISEVPRKFVSDDSAVKAIEKTMQQSTVFGENKIRPVPRRRSQRISGRGGLNNAGDPTQKGNESDLASDGHQTPIRKSRRISLQSSECKMVATPSGEDITKTPMGKGRKALQFSGSVLGKIEDASPEPSQATLTDKQSPSMSVSKSEEKVEAEKTTTVLKERTEIYDDEGIYQFLSDDDNISWLKFPTKVMSPLIDVEPRQESLVRKRKSVAETSETSCVIPSRRQRNTPAKSAAETPMKLKKMTPANSKTPTARRSLHSTGKKASLNEEELVCTGWMADHTSKVGLGEVDELMAWHSICHLSIHTQCFCFISLLFACDSFKNHSQIFDLEL